MRTKAQTSHKHEGFSFSEVEASVNSSEMADFTKYLQKYADIQPRTYWYETIGLLAIADEIRPEIAETIRLLKTMGVKRVTMLTGDHPQVAEAVAKAIGVDDFIAEMLPEQKQEFVKALQAEGHVVGMIGDGINDAPALALVDVDIAMGAVGTDVAIETADVTLMSDDISRVVDFMWMSGKVLRGELNIFFSIIYNVIGLTLGVIGLMTPVIAVIFQEAGCATVVLSSTFLLWSKMKTAK